MIGALLRCEGRFAVDRDEVPWRSLCTVVVLGGWIYGAAMGLGDGRVLQALYSAVKVPVLLAVATLVCLPSFYVLNTVLGLRDDFFAATRGVIASQATVALTLASLAPVTLFAYASSDDYPFALVLNGAFFGIAAGNGHLTASRHYRRLVAKDPRHRVGRFAWTVLYVFVAIQAAWVLRPFVGSPGNPTRFFREDAWSNAYVAVANTVARLLQ